MNTPLDSIIRNIANTAGKPMTDDNFHFSEFTSLDKSKAADFLIHSMDVMFSLPSVQSVKSHAIDQLAIKPTDQILNPGCGLGQETHLIAEKLTSPGRVIGIDNSQRMLDTAKKCYPNLQADFQLGNTEKLDFPDEQFDAVYADRLLVSHANVDLIMTELTRVLRPGGRLCLTDVDAASIIISPDTSVTELFLNELLTCFVNPKMGRQLATLFAKHALNDIHLETQLSSIPDFSVVENIFQINDILSACINHHTLTTEEGENWINTLKNATRNGTFYYSVTFFTVIGTKK